MTLPDNLSRRALFMKLGILFNGIIAAFLAIPILRYVLAPVTRGLKFGYEAWLPLGSLEQFPAAKRVSELSAIPTFSPGMARPPTATAGSAASTIAPFRSLPSIACILAAPFAGSRNLAFSCAPATVVSTTKTADAHRVLPNVAFTNTLTRLNKGSSSSKPGNCPLPLVPAPPAHSSI